MTLWPIFWSTSVTNDVEAGKQLGHMSKFICNIYPMVSTLLSVTL